VATFTLFENLGDQAGYIELAVAGRRACVNSKLRLNGESELPPAAWQWAWCEQLLQVRFTSLRADQTHKVVSVHRGFAFPATSVSASPAPAERQVCKAGSRSFAQDRVARPSLAPRFVREQRPRPGCGRGDTAWLDRGDWTLLQRSSQASTRNCGGNRCRLIVRILKHCCDAIDLGRMPAPLWLPRP
jgi:hypothetical protein